MTDAVLVAIIAAFPSVLGTVVAMKKKDDNGGEIESPKDRLDDIVNELTSGFRKQVNDLDQRVAELEKSNKELEEWLDDAVDALYVVYLYEEGLNPGTRKRVEIILRDRGKIT